MDLAEGVRFEPTGLAPRSPAARLAARSGIDGDRPEPIGRLRDDASDLGPVPWVRIFHGDPITFYEVTRERGGQIAEDAEAE